MVSNVFEHSKVLFEFKTHFFINNVHIGHAIGLCQCFVQNFVEIFSHCEARQDLVLLDHDLASHLLAPLVLDHVSVQESSNTPILDRGLGDGGAGRVGVAIPPPASGDSWPP